MRYNINDKSKTCEELFIVLFIPRCHSSSKETISPSSSCLAHKSTIKTKRVQVTVVRCLAPNDLRYAFSFAHFDNFPLVFKYLSCKTCFLQYKWNYVNSKGICVKRLLISPILDNYWRSNVVVSDRQQIPQA